MKKYAMFLLIALMALLPACTAAPTAAPGDGAAPEETTAPAGKPVIAVVLPALDNPLMLGFQDAFTGAFSADYDVQVTSADGNPNTQDKSLIPAFKAAGDWCAKHGLPLSQCLKCNPNLKIIRPPKGSK